MRKVLASLLLLLILAPALRAEVINRVVLRVNDRIATLYEYQQRREEMGREILRREQDAEERQRLLTQAGEVVYANMFQELLLDSRADQLGVEIGEAQVDAAIDRLKEGYNIKTDQEFQAALAQSGMTEQQLRGPAPQHPAHSGGAGPRGAEPGQPGRGRPAALLPEEPGAVPPARAGAAPRGGGARGGRRPGRRARPHRGRDPQPR